MTKKEDNNIIRCPKCGYEYHLAEIFDTEDIFGSPDNILRNKKGKILNYTLDEENHTVEWTCDGCGCNFKVSITNMPQVKVDYIEEHDFSEDFSIEL